MTSVGTSGAVKRVTYDKAYPRVSDAVSLYLWRAPAFGPVRWASAAGMRATAAIAVEGLVALLVFALFWHGRLWAGLILAALVTGLGVVTLMLTRLGHAPSAIRRLRVAVEFIHPLLWWWGWEHGLAAWGRPLEPIYAIMVLWAVVGGAVAIAIVEALVLHRFNGMEIHAWRALDSRFRLVGASRNMNLLILAAALLAGRPDSGLVVAAWWTLISLIFHAVRFAQMTERQARGHKTASWLDQ